MDTSAPRHAEACSVQNGYHSTTKARTGTNKTIQVHIKGEFAYWAGWKE